MIFFLNFMIPLRNWNNSFDILGSTFLATLGGTIDCGIDITEIFCRINHIKLIIFKDDQENCMERVHNDYLLE